MRQPRELFHARKIDMKEKTILVVEDDPDQMELTLITLENISSGGKIAAVRDGAEALDYLFGTGSYQSRDTSVQPDVIFLDIKLRKLSGLEVLKRIRSNRRTAMIPVVMLTSSCEEEDILSAYKNGANSFVRKSVDFQEFTDKLRALHTYWLSVNIGAPVP
ncbi:MAG: response regulator [Burkholderiaceae bacterium]|nr:response regulator [Burkholderiaceae bacterium]MDO9090948.1 response regulator [Burkholderiaceae bacterium]